MRLFTLIQSLFSTSLPKEKKAFFFFRVIGALFWCPHPSRKLSNRAKDHRRSLGRLQPEWKAKGFAPEYGELNLYGTRKPDE